MPYYQEPVKFPLCLAVQRSLDFGSPAKPYAVCTYLLYWTICTVYAHVGVLDCLTTEILGQGYIFSFRVPSSYLPGMWLSSPPKEEGIEGRSKLQTYDSILQFGIFPREEMLCYRRKDCIPISRYSIFILTRCHQNTAFLGCEWGESENLFHPKLVRFLRGNPGSVCRGVITTPVAQPFGYFHSNPPRTAGCPVCAPCQTTSFLFLASSEAF